MKKLLVLPLAALTFAACSHDLPTSALSDADFSRRAAPTTTSSAVFDLVTPVITSPADGAEISSRSLTLEWTGEWNTNGTSSFTFGHFEIYLNGAKVAETQGKSYLMELEGDGPWMFQVKAMAKEGTGTTTLTHHSLMSAAVTVRLAQSVVWTVDAIGGNAADRQYPRNGDRATLRLGLHRNGVLFHDGCAAASALSFSGSFTVEGRPALVAVSGTARCEIGATEAGAPYNRYLVDFDNPGAAQGQNDASSGTLSFALPGAAVANTLTVGSHN